MPLTGIHNESEFHSCRYLAQVFASDIQGPIERWRKEAQAASTRNPAPSCAPSCWGISAAATSSSASGAAASASSSGASGSAGCSG